MKQLLILLFVFIGSTAFCQSGQKIVIHTDGGGGGGVIDTFPLHRQLLQKLNISDTTNKWQPKGTYLKPGDTTFLHNNLIGKLNISDTTNKWQPKGTYLTTQINPDWNANSGAAQILNKPTIPDNNNQLANGAGYVSRIELGDSLAKKDTIKIIPFGNGDYFLSGSKDSMFQYAFNLFGSTGINISRDITATERNYTISNDFNALRFPLTISLKNPSATEDRVVFYTPIDLYVTNLSESIKGINPSITYAVKFGTDRASATTNVVLSHALSATSAAGGSVTSGNAGVTVIPAGSFIVLTTSAVSGTIDDFYFGLIFHE